MKNIIPPATPVTYSLRIVKKDTDFYTELDEYRKKLINTAKIEYFGTVSSYQTYVEEYKIEEPRKWEEYFLELLMIGVFWSVYSPLISVKTKYYRVLFNALYFIRTKSKMLKPGTDRIRGYLAMLLLQKNQLIKPGFDLKNIRLLICWLDCTKEFTEEVKRLANWITFFDKNPDVFKNIQDSIFDFTCRFKEESQFVFSEYTKNVEKFLAETHPGYKGEENYFFTGRKEVEYHLNMVGASILNEVLKEEFNTSKNKVVLLPTCMSSGKSCKAKSKGLEMVCTHCTPSCNVSKISKELEENNIKSVLIPHSSKFSQFLKMWANQKETGLVGVACVLNLIRGGYELIDLNILSQCVFLDYCGCKKHWGKTGPQSTNLNLEQLKKILHIENTRTRTVNFEKFDSYVLNDS